MISIGLALLLSLQQEGWQETSFHRIFLRNGNFIDGKVISDKPNEVILQMRGGEMAIRRDQVERVEFMKLKSYNDKPIILATPKSKTPDAVQPKNTPPVTVEAAEQIKKKVDQIIFKLKTSQSPEKEFPVEEFQPLGDEGTAYAASKAPMFDLKLLDALSALLINLKPGEKTVQVLESLVGNEKPPVRAMAGTVLVVTGGDAARAKYLRPLIQDADAKVRETAIGLLGNTEDGDWFDLMAELSADPVREVRNRAMRNARQIAQKKGWQDQFIRTLSNNVGHSDPGVRSDSAQMIGALGVKEAWSYLTAPLSDQDPAVRAIVAQAIMTLGAPESGEVVVRALQRETDLWTRIYLAGAAQKLKLMAAVDIFIEWLNSPEEKIRNVAEGSLKAITGLTFGYDTAKWEEWNKTRQR